jgi:hypothetical protein
VKKAPQLRLSQIFKYAVGILTIWTEPFALARDLAGRIFMSTGKATLAHFDAHCRVHLMVRMKKWLLERVSQD